MVFRMNPSFVTNNQRDPVKPLCLSKSLQSSGSSNEVLHLQGRAGTLAGTS